VLHRFKGKSPHRDGNWPYGNVIFDSSGNLYGTTVGGGNPNHCLPHYGCGTVFELTLSADGSWKEKVLHRFLGGMDGSVPYAGLIFDPAGNLYGTTSAGGNLLGDGGGIVFKLTQNPDGTWKEKILHRFTKSGDNPVFGVTLDAAGNLYGTTREAEGGPNPGSVFEITP
jgi:uncharacterized repeat protein (TIGR03803 family)